MTETVSVATRNGVRVHHPQTAEQAVELLRRCWSGPREDVFSFDLAVVPGPGFQRWLSQQLAVGEVGAGICAGIEFTTLSALRHRLTGDDPWHPDRLVWLLQRLATTSDSPTLADLRRHLDASRETYSACLKIARMFAGYATFRPALLQQWSVGQDLGPNGSSLAENAWQAELWRSARDELGDPLERRAGVLAELSQQAVPGLPSRVAVIAPPALDEPMLDLLNALGSHHQVDLLTLTPSPSRWPAAAGRVRRADYRRPSGHPLNDALATAADEQALLLPPPTAVASVAAAPVTRLARLQAELRTDTVLHAPAPDLADDSITFHLCHGPDRQVEVLREVLAGVLAADPTLEPRHIVVLTPDVDAYAPLVTAAFGLPVVAGGHPGHGFRVQLADRSVAQTNPVVGLLLDLLRLPDSRFEASHLLDLCAQPALAARFGFAADRHDRLVELVERSGIRWGLSGPQRSSFGLEGFPQNTWQAGVQRMLLGVALSESDLVTARTVLPLDDVDSSDVDLIGGLAELIGRLARLLATFAASAPMAEWAQRCRTAIEGLVWLPPDQEWQLGDVWAGLARVVERADETPLTRHGAQRVLEAEFRGRPARAAFGNGSVVVAGLASLRHVPHRVVVLLGWDADRYPRTGDRNGDDLLRLDPYTGDPAAPLTDRQLLLDAVLAAREKLIVVARGHSETTNEQVPLAAPLQELRAAIAAEAGQITRQHPLQPFDPAYFDPAVPELTSIDPVAFAGAQAALEVARRRASGAKTGERDRYRLAPLPPLVLSAGVTLDELTAFFGHPARQLLKVRAGLSLSEGRELTDSLPVELDALDRWRLGNRMLSRVQAGADPERVRATEWLRGEVPPAELGGRELDRLFADVNDALRKAPPSVCRPVHEGVSLDVPVPGHGLVPLSGRVTSVEGNLIHVGFSNPAPRHRLEAWLQLLAYVASAGGRPQAIRVGRSRRVVLNAPEPSVAIELLGRYLALYALGLSVPIPALPRVCERLARIRSHSEEARHPATIAPALKDQWEWDSDENWRAFYRFPDLLDLPAAAVALPGPSVDEPSLVGALAQLIWKPLLEQEEAR